MFRVLAIFLGFSAIFPIAPAIAQPFHHEFGEWRQYSRDWLGACPDAIDENSLDYYGTHCFASTGTEVLNDAGLPAYKLTLLLDRLDGDIDVAFTAAPTDGTELDETRPLVITFGGEPPMEFAFGTDLETRYNTTNMYFVAQPAMRDTLIAAMQACNSASVTIPIVGPAGTETADIRLSMRGVLGSIDFMQTYARRIEGYDE